MKKIASDILEENQIEYKQFSRGFSITKGEYIHAKATINPSKEKALITAFDDGIVILPNIKITASCQSMDASGIKDPINELKNIGFLVLSISYDSFGPCYFITVYDSERINLPDWCWYQ